jgi:hypothetical protein
MSALFLSLVLVSCGSPDAVAPTTLKLPAESSVHLPDPKPATAAFIIRTKRALPEKKMQELRGVRGVSVIAGVGTRKLKVRTKSKNVRVLVGEVKPLEYRNVAPSATRNADFVWTSLILGGAVPTPGAAKALGLTNPEELTIAGVPGFSVGALADNGVPNVADVIIGSAGQERLKMPEPRTFVIGAKTGAIVETLQENIAAVLPAAELERLIPTNDELAVSSSAGASAVQFGEVTGGVVGAMRFEILDDGFIRPDPAWVEANITSAVVPILGTVTCHRLMIPRLGSALNDIVEAGLANEIRTSDYGGCYVPRFIDRDTTKPLSNHAFGLAIDLNTSTNGLGTKGDIDPRVVRIFQSWGFTWGGLWSRPDPMHFELTS